MLAAKHVDNPLQLAWCLDDNLVPRCELERWHALEDYRAQLRAFAQVSGFDAFFTAHARYYKDVDERIAQAIDADKPAAWLDAVYGKPGGTFTVIPGLAEGPATIALADDLDRALVVGIDHLDGKDLPVVGDATQTDIVRAMIHAYVDPVLARHDAELAHAGEVMFGLTSQAMRRQGLATWQLALADAVARATLVVYTRDRHGAQAAADATRAQLRHGFAWTNEIAEAVARPKSSAAPTPRHSCHRSSPPSRRSPRATRTACRRIRSTAPIDAALDADPTAAIYGTPADKPIVDLVARTGWAVTATGVTLGTRTVSGSGLVLVACYPRRDDPTRGVVAHIAASQDDLAGIDDVRRGTTDWMIARHACLGWLRRHRAG